jgi:paired amphipathic helix protein Sin3a
MDDKGVIFDTLKLTLAYLERAQSGFSAPERERVEGFLRLFTPMMFGVTKEEVEEQLGAFVIKHAADEDDEPELDSEADGSDAGMTEDSSMPSRSSTPLAFGLKRPGPKAIAADLRRRLLASTLKHAPKVNGLVAEQRKKVKEHSLVLGQEETWISAHPEPLVDGSPRPISTPEPSSQLEQYPLDFFCGSTLYCLVRSFHVRIVLGLCFS